MSTKKYRIKPGQIYIAADKSKVGHVVIDVDTFAYCNDVVTMPFTSEQFYLPNNRINAFELSEMCYQLIDKVPSWMPTKPPETRNGERPLNGNGEA